MAGRCEKICIFELYGWVEDVLKKSGTLGLSMLNW